MPKIFKIIILIILIILTFMAGFLLGKNKNIQQNTEIIKKETVKSISKNLTDQGVVPKPAEQNFKIIQAQILEIKKNTLKLNVYPVTIEDLLTNQQYIKNLKITDKTQIYEITPNNQPNSETDLTTKTKINFSNLKEKNTITILLNKNWNPERENLEAEEIFIYR